MSPALRPDVDNHVSLLLDIYERLGAIEANQKIGAAGHGELKEALEKVSDRLALLEKIAPAINRMEPIVKDYEQNRSKIAGIILVLCTVFGALGLFVNTVKTFFMGHS